MNPNRIRVMMVMDSLAVGGTETHVLSIVKALKKRGIHSIYAGASGNMYEAYARAGCQIHAVDLSPGTLLHLQNHMLPKIISSLKQIMKTQKINVVHVHQSPSGLYAAMAAKELGIPVVFTAHGTYYPEDQLSSMNQYSDAVISVSHPVKHFLESMNIQSELIPNGVNPDEFIEVDSSSLRSRLGIPDHADTIVYASRLSWDKAYVCTMLIWAARRLRLEGRSQLNIVIVGDGHQYHEIRELSNSIESEIGQPFIHMVGSQKKVRDYLSLADIVVGTGRVALEAMACGKPVIAIGNHGYFGLVTPSIYEQAWKQYFGDHASICKPSEELIANELREALANKASLRKTGLQGRKWTLEHFDIHKIVDQLEDLYRHVILQAGQEEVQHK